MTENADPERSIVRSYNPIGYAGVAGTTWFCRACGIATTGPESVDMISHYSDCPNRQRYAGQET